jgi:hypothetical protein
MIEPVLRLCRKGQPGPCCSPSRRSGTIIFGPKRTVTCTDLDATPPQCARSLRNTKTYPVYQVGIWRVAWVTLGRRLDNARLLGAAKACWRPESAPVNAFFLNSPCRGTRVTSEQMVRPSRPARAVQLCAGARRCGQSSSSSSSWSSALACLALTRMSRFPAWLAGPTRPSFSMRSTRDAARL